MSVVCLEKCIRIEAELLQDYNNTMAYTVRDKKVIVTGGAHGIGYEYCYYLLLNGAKTVAILDLSQANGELSVSKLNEEFGSGRALFFQVDVTKFDELEVVFEKAMKALHGLDILINNAGILHDALWEKMIAVNFTAVVKSTLLGYDYMGKHKGGKGGVIVNVASVVSLVPAPTAPVYTATKFGVRGFTIALADHFEKTGVSVRVMCPGVTDTPLITDETNRYLNFVDPAEASQTLLGYHRQPTEIVGKAMIDVIEKGANGSVWVSQHSNPPFAVELPKFANVTL